MKALRNEKRNQQLTISALVLLCIPFFFWVKLPSSLSYIDLSLYLALMTGFIGTIILLGQFLLGTRSINALLFDDQAWALRFHKNMGIYGTLLIFAHPLLMLLPYAQNIWYIFVPDFSSPFEKAVTWGRIGLVLLLVVWITSALVRGRLKYRSWKYIHYLGYGVLPLAFIHSPPVGRSLTESRGLLLYWYLLAAMYLLMIVLRMRHLFGYSKNLFRVENVSIPSEEAVLLQLHSLERPMRFEPGQYVYLQLTLHGEEHPFSVLDADQKTGRLLVAFRPVGSFTQKLSALLPGDRLYLDGPYGTFTRRTDDSQVESRVYIAGGIGVTPFVSRIMHDDDAADQVLFYCNRTLTSGPFRQELQRKLGGHYVDVLSQDDATGTNIEHGYLNGDIISKYISQPTKYDYYICGPAGMMRQVRQGLLNLGIAEQRIHLEEFSF